MDKLNLLVRKDWEQHLRLRSAEETQLWRIGQLILLFSALVLFWVTILPLQPLWHNALRFSVTWAPFLAFSLWTIIRRERHSMRYALLLLLAFIGLSFAAAYLDPRVPSGISDVLPYWAVVISLAIPLISWSVIFPVLRRAPHRARQMGLHLQDLPINVLLGLMAGGALALHLLYTTSQIPNEDLARLSFSRSALFWSFSLLAGLWVPGEEFLFRGLGFHLLHERGRAGFWATTLRITLLDVVLYLVLALQTPSIALSLLTIVYRTGLSIICAFLFYRRKSLMPCMVANLVFTFVMLQLFQL